MIATASATLQPSNPAPESTTRSFAARRCPPPGSALIALLALCAACHSGSAGSLQTGSVAPPRIANLHAFARLYGVLRWFHPSDAAAAIDWDRFATEGVRRVADAPDRPALRAVLSDLIAPIAPTARVVAAGEPSVEAPALPAASAADGDVVAWQHSGYGDSIVVSAYASKRRHRERTVAAPGVRFAALSQAIDATAYRGARLRLRGKLRTADRARGQLWLRVDRGDATGFFDNMDRHPVVSASWAPAEIVGTVDPDATRIVFGTLMNGPGTTWYDDLELAVQGSDGAWQPIEIKDPGFDAEPVFASWSPGIGKRSIVSLDGWNATLDHAQPASGTAALRVERATRIVTDELFADAPRPGETVDVDLGGGLRARVPIALYSKDGHTIGDPATAPRSASAAPAAPAPRFDATSGIADVIVLWNVLEHFWPYWDLVAVDWNAELDIALRDALDDRSVDDHVDTLRRVSAAAPDGHARTTCSGESQRAYPPFQVELIEGRVVVTETGNSAISRGDVVVAIDGRPATEPLVASEALISGSPQWKASLAAREFGAGSVDSKLIVRVHRGGADLDVSIARRDRLPEQYAHPPIDRFDDGVYYVDLGRATMREIDAVMDRLAAAPGVVFDLRGYPNGNHDVLSHLLTKPDDSRAWMAVAHVIRPDHAPSSIASWDTSGWEMPVLQPHIAGRVAFLTGPGAISYAESVMGLVEHYHLGEIVGSATAGTNGDIAVIAEPSGCQTWFTGLRVTKHDGTQHHLIGIQPTIPASRTIAGVLAGSDEVLERALAYVRGASR